MDGQSKTSSDSLVFSQEDKIKHVIVSDSETIQPIDNQKPLQENKYAPTSKSKISVLPQGVDMRSNSSPQRGEEAIQSERKRTLGVQVRGEINSHTEEQHLQSAECWLKTQAVCKTFQPNAGTFNVNVVIGNEVSQNREAIKISRHTEQSEVSHSRENITNNAIH